jgi:hypothetical protein
VKKVLYLSLMTTLLVVSILFTFHLQVLANPNDETVEGDMTRFVTGNAYPTQIVFAGYNATTDELYLNVDLEGGSNYDYEATVFQGSNAAVWGTVTDTGVLNATAPAIEVQNKKISASVNGTDLELAHRIVVTVTNYTP